jgi:hypothetical protein
MKTAVPSQEAYSRGSKDQQFARYGEWALASDKLQGVLQKLRVHYGKEDWTAMSFVRSTRDTLARCMKEKGVPSEAITALLKGLPATFNQWQAAQQVVGE